MAFKDARRVSLMKVALAALTAGESVRQRVLRREYRVRTKVRGPSAADRGSYASGRPSPRNAGLPPRPSASRRLSLAPCSADGCNLAIRRRVTARPNARPSHATACAPTLSHAYRAPPLPSSPAAAERAPGRSIAPALAPFRAHTFRPASRTPTDAPFLLNESALPRRPRARRAQRGRGHRRHT
jgi:hypothetical protein